MNILKKIRAKQADLFAPPVAIAFLGDSVTQGCFEVYLTSEGAVQTVFEPESGYAADVRKLFALLYPGVPVQFINAGISGDNAPSGLQRLERDVLAYHPDLTVVCFGLNDACRGDETQEEYASALDGIFTKLKEAGSEIIFMTPNMMNTRLSEKLTVPEIRAVAEDTLKISWTAGSNAIWTRPERSAHGRALRCATAMPNGSCSAKTAWIPRRCSPTASTIPAGRWHGCLPIRCWRR